MTFVVYATYSVAIAIFIFWFGVWMLHLIAITYGKIRLHKKSRLHQKLQQHDLLQHHQRHHHSNLLHSSSVGGGLICSNSCSLSSSSGKGGGSGKSHYDDLHSANYHNLHQLMQHHGPISSSPGNSSLLQLKQTQSGSVGGGSDIVSPSSNSQTMTQMKGAALGRHNKSSSCDYSSIIRDRDHHHNKATVTGLGLLAASSSNSRETVINLNCDESKDLLSTHRAAVAQNLSSAGNATTSPLLQSSSLTSASTNSPSLSSSGAAGIASLSLSSSSGVSSGSSSCNSSPESMLVALRDSERDSLLSPSGTAATTTGTTDVSQSASSGALVLPSTDLLAADNSAAVAGDALLMRKTAAEIVNRLPKVSILKPLMGIDSNLAANLETFFTMDYPRQHYEILFCVESADDPVLGLCESLIEKYRGEVDARLFIGGEQVGVNPKINNMEPGYREAKYELVMISDAGIKLKPDTLMDMVEHMTEKVALVHQMPFTCDREGFAATYEKIFFGTMQSRIYLVSDCLNVICHTGMSCLVRKKVLEGLGGLRAFGCYLAEDFFMAKAITEDGWKTTISSYPALQNSGVCDVRTFHNRLVRWAKLRIAMLSWLILLEPMSECLIVGAFASWGVSILFRWDGVAFYLIHILCWFLADWMLLTIVQNGSVSFNKFDFVCGWLFRELSGPYLFFCALWNPAIRWRTRIYKLDWGGVAYELNSSTKIKT